MSESPGPDEDLVDLAGPGPLGTRNRRIVAVVTVALLIVLVGLRLAAGHRSSHRAVPKPVPTPTPAVEIGPSPVDVTPGSPNFRKNDPSFCPTTITCMSVDVLPSVVLATIGFYLPHASFSSEYSVVQARPTRLYYRQFDASANNLRIAVRVSRTERMQDPTPTQATDRPPGQSIGYVRTVTGDGYVVEVRFTGLPAYRPPMADIRALAADPRLLALG